MQNRSQPFVTSMASLAEPGGHLYNLMKLVALLKLGNLLAATTNFAPLPSYLELVDIVGGFEVVEPMPASACVINSRPHYRSELKN